MNELENALDRVNDTSPGEDKINYQMIRKLDNNSKNCIHNIFNKFWGTWVFPSRMPALCNYSNP